MEPILNEFDEDMGQLEENAFILLFAFELILDIDAGDTEVKEGAKGSVPKVDDE